jgi:hypothetical protein
MNKACATRGFISPCTQRVAHVHPAGTRTSLPAKTHRRPRCGHLERTFENILGSQAALLIQPLVQAASTGLSVAEMARGQYWTHPALSEVVENALLKLPLSG